MDALAADGFVLCAGPLSGTENARLRALLIVNAESEAEIHHRLDHDPWAASGHLETVSVEPWRCSSATTGSWPTRRRTNDSGFSVPMRTPARPPRRCARGCESDRAWRRLVVLR
jgi:hypothetical protein